MASPWATTSISVKNILRVVKAIHEIMKLDEKICSFMIYMVVFGLLAVIVEPEKIKPLAFLLSFFIFGSGKEWINRP